MNNHKTHNDMKNLLNTFVIALMAIRAVSCTCSETASDQTKKDEKPYNLQKAWEVLQESHDEPQAIKLLTEQLQSTPDNVEYWMLLCRIYRNSEEYGAALTAVNEAIKVNKPKKTGLFDSTLWWWKGSVYDDLGKTERSVECLRKSLNLARIDNKDNVQSISFYLAQGLYELKRFDEADAVYRQMLKDDDSDQSAMVGLARNRIERGDYKGAIELLDKSIKYDADYTSAYKYRSKAYDKLGETNKAIDDALTCFEKDDDTFSTAMVQMMMKHRYYAIAKAKAKMRSSDNKSQWRVLLIWIYEKSCEYKNALAEYDALENDYGKDEFIYYHRADCEIFSKLTPCNYHPDPLFSRYCPRDRRVSSGVNMVIITKLSPGLSEIQFQLVCYV